MGRILRNITMSPVEPAQLSFQAPRGMQTILDMTLNDTAGNPLKVDVAGQLQLIRRTDGRTQSYATPATDIVNGKLRATFPEGELNDKNGYRLRLFGTVNGLAELIAIGEVRITQTMGPMAMPDDVIDEIPLTFTYATPVQLDVALWQDAYKTTPYDLTAVTVTSAVYPASANPVPLVAFTQQSTGPNTLRLSLTAAEVDALPPACWWSLRVSSAGQVKTLAEGPVSVASAPAASSEALSISSGGLP